MIYSHNKLNESYIQDDILSNSGIDPVDECMIAIAEEDHNFNIFLKELGIQEIMEASNGNNNPSKFRNFINKVVLWLQKMWDKISEIFDNFTASLQSHKVIKFIEKNKDSIKDGSVGGEWSYTGIDIGEIGNNIEYIFSSINDAYANSKNIKKIYGNKMTESEIIKRICEKETNSIEDLPNEYLDIKEVTIKNKKGIYTDVLSTDYLKKKVREIRELKNKVKSSYNESIKQIKNLQNEDEDTIANVSDNVMTAIKVVNVLSTISIKLIKMQYDAAYKLAKILMSSNKNIKNENFKLTNAFYQAVQSGDVLSVRIMMQDSLLVDPTFTEFNAMEKAASSMIGLYDEHDGKELIEDRNLWNDDYMDKVMVKILSNFSHERIDHLKEVVRYLRPVAGSTGPKNEANDIKSEKPFIELVNEKDIKGLRNYISSWFGLCPTLKGNKCDKYMNYLEEVGIDITEPYRMNISEKPTPKDRSQWTEALYFRKVEYLRLNFAYNERVPELKEISKVVFAKQIAKEKLRRK